MIHFGLIYIANGGVCVLTDRELFPVWVGDVVPAISESRLHELFSKYVVFLSQGAGLSFSRSYLLLVYKIKPASNLHICSVILLKHSEAV